MLHEPESREAIGQAEILGIRFSDLTYSEVLTWTRGVLGANRPHQIVLANVHTLNLAYESVEYRRRLTLASLVLRDGSGVKQASRWYGRPLRHNYVGTDFIPQLVRDLAPGDVSVFLFGARPGVAARAAVELCRRCPGARVAGALDGFIDRTDALRRINAARPDLLLVALGNPLQECWIADNLARLDVKLAIGVGALFDYLAGEVRRAPRWVRRAGCEWVFRLLVEPTRLWRRYLIGNPKFIYRVLRARFRPVRGSDANPVVDKSHAGRLLW